MPRKTYATEFKAQLVALVRQGRSAESLAKEYEPSAPTIRAWVEEASRGSVPDDKDARIRHLERELARVQEEREILKKAAAWFAAESGSSRSKGSRS
jgi:transposase